MKVSLFFIVPLIFTALTACSKVEAENEIPVCIAWKIQNMENAPVQNPPGKVWKWKDDQNTYYYISSDCCDQYNYLYDNQCNVVCAPTGGFTGGGDGNCPTFQGTVQKSLVWEDPRE